MSNTSITKTQNTSKSQEKKPERFIPYDANVSYDDITNSDVSHAEFRVYCSILAYGKKFGHLSVSTEHFLEDNPVFSERQFQEHCKSLQEKGFIYRFHHPLHHRGSMRYLIPKPYWQPFTKYIIKKYKRAGWAAEVEVFFEGGDYEGLRKSYQLRISGPFIKSKGTPKYKVTQSSTRGLTAPPSDTRINRASINNINIIKEEENSNRGKSVLPFFTDFGNEEVTQEWMEYISKNLKLNLHQLEKLYDTSKEYFDKCKNPRGALIAAIKGGYANEKIHKAEEKMAKEKTAIDESKKKAQRRKVAHQVAQAIQRDLKYRKIDKYSVSVHELNTFISPKGTNSSSNFMYDEPDTIDRLLQFARENGIEIDLTKENMSVKNKSEKNKENKDGPTI